MITYETMQTVETVRQLAEAIAKLEAVISSMDMAIHTSNFNDNMDSKLITKHRAVMIEEVRRLDRQLKATEREILANI